VRVTSERLVSFTQRAIAAIAYHVEPIDTPTRLVVQSELVANEPLGEALLTTDPRRGVPLSDACLSELNVHRDLRAALVHRTALSGLRVAAAMDHLVDGPPGLDTSIESTPDTARVSVTVRLEPGQRLSIVKLLAYGWSSQRSRQALVDQVLAALTAARHTGWEGLLAEQRHYLDDFWNSADVELEGDDEVQQAVRFGLFHILQAGARGEDRRCRPKA
jgi:alpha,alpha-trehalose phosphorylase